jgi:hypothetical protein
MFAAEHHDVGQAEARVGSGFDEVWLEAPDGQSLCALINGEVGWLMYLRQPGDSGFSSRNPSYAGDPHAEIEYVLANGQRDAHPAGWALPLPEVRKALDYFGREHQRPPFISWHQD